MAVENLPEPLNQEESMVTGGDQDLQSNSETPRERANRLRREHKASQSAVTQRKTLRHNFDGIKNPRWNRSAINNHLNQNSKKPPLWMVIRATYHRIPGNLSQDAGDLSQEEDDMYTMMASLADPANEKYYTIYLHLYNI